MNDGSNRDVIRSTGTPINNDNLITWSEGCAPARQGGLQECGTVLTSGDDRDANGISSAPSAPRSSCSCTCGECVCRGDGSSDRGGLCQSGSKGWTASWPILLWLFAVGNTSEVTGKSVGCRVRWKGLGAEEEAEEEEESCEKEKEEEGEETIEREMGETCGVLKGKTTINDEFAGCFVGAEDAINAGTDEMDERGHGGCGRGRRGRERDEDRGGGERGWETGGATDVGGGFGARVQGGGGGGTRRWGCCGFCGWRHCGAEGRGREGGREEGDRWGMEWEGTEDEDGVCTVEAGRKECVEL